MDGLATVRFDCSLSAGPVPLPHVWEYLVGSDHAPMALRCDWRAQLQRCRDQLGFRYIRFHGLLSDDMSTLISIRGKPCYSFFNADQIFDFLLTIGMKPFIELSFMPRSLASGATSVFHYRGNVTPPKDYREWAALVHELASHLVDRYGIGEVSQWYFEVWNEPNLAKFWTGGREAYFELYRYAASAIKAVHPGLRVGGPATAANAWVADFIEFCDANRLPADFVSTHHYPNDESGNEEEAPELALSRGRRGVLRDQARTARSQARGRPVLYTEWNTSAHPRDPLHDEPYAAAFIVKTALEAASLVDGYGFWTFSDLFEEEGFSSQPFHGGFGLLTIHGIAKPSFRAFELLHRLPDHALQVTGTHVTVDAWMTRDANEAALVLANHALPRHRIGTEHVQVRLTDALAPVSATIDRIDFDHANAKGRWQQMGAPDYLDAAQASELEAASRLRPEPQAWRYRDGAIELDVVVPPHAVAVVTLRLGDAGP